MKNSKGSAIRLGIFIILGTVIFLAVIYYLANQRHFFSPMITISAEFRTVSGLQEGNNVYFTGISVGIVDDIKITSDTSVLVKMNVEKDASKYIKKNSRATIASLGLMGNKYVNILPGDEPAEPIQSGDVIATVPPVDIDDVLRVLQRSGANTMEVTQNLAEVTRKINEGVGVVGKLLTDTIMANEVQQMIHDLQEVNVVIARFKEAAGNTNKVTRDLEQISGRINRGEGLAGALVKDEQLVFQFRNMMDSLELAGARTAMIAEDLNMISNRLKEGEGTAGRLLKDTTTVNKIDSTMLELQKAALEFQQTMHELRTGWLFRLLN